MCKCCSSDFFCCLFVFATQFWLYISQYSAFVSQFWLYISQLCFSQFWVVFAILTLYFTIMTVLQFVNSGNYNSYLTILHLFRNSVFVLQFWFHISQLWLCLAILTLYFTIMTLSCNSEILPIIINISQFWDCLTILHLFRNYDLFISHNYDCLAILIHILQFWDGLAILTLYFSIMTLSCNSEILAVIINIS